MEKYILWFAGLRRFNQILVAGAVFFGMAAFATGIATENPVFLVLAVFWLVVAPATVWWAAAREQNQQ